MFGFYYNQMNENTCFFNKNFVGILYFIDFNKLKYKKPIRTSKQIILKKQRKKQLQIQHQVQYQYLNQQLFLKNKPKMMNSQPFKSTSQNPKTNPYLTPAYLLTLSSHIQTLSTFYQQQNLPSLTGEYKLFLQSTFKNLANSLNLFSQDQTFLVSSLISTKVQLETYLGEKLYGLLQLQTQSIAEIIKFILMGYKQNAQHYDQILIRQKKTKVELQHQKNDQVVNNLKKQVIIKREYVKQLQQRIKDLQEQNSKIYQKIIDNAKNTISSTLIQSKVLTSSSEFMAQGKYSKLTTNLPQQSSTAIGLKVSHKQMSLKQVQQTILQILNSKRKKQSISMKRISMKSYVRYFFKYKFGLNDLCDEMRTNFLSAVRHFLSSRNEQTTSTESLGINVSSQQQKPLLLLFQKLLDEQIDESYFWNEYIPRGLKVIKLFKRYLNQKQKVQFKQLDRLYEGYQGISGSISNYSTNKIIFNEQQRKDFELDENDVRQILCNFYTKSKEIETLQMIFAEIIGNNNPSQQKDNWIGFEENSIFFSRMKQPTVQQTVLSKQLLALILCYEIESYSIKLTSLNNIIKRHSSTLEFVTINYTALQKIVLQMRIQEQKYLPYFQQNFIQLKDKQFSYSQIVEIIDSLTNVDSTKQKYSSGQTYSSRKL